MKSRYELTISTNYVSNWTYIEAFRELFQNAIDNETTNPENKMLFEFTGDSIKICNKHSILDVSSLLMGSTTKAGDENTIGKHGEGYKVAFVVLLRKGKTIKVYNYGKREIWETRLVKSKRFGGVLVPCITIEREAFWKEVPDNDLTIEVGNVSAEEYSDIVRNNLHLRPGKIDCYDIPKSGRILLDKEESGRVYVKGLYVTTKPDMVYGYDFMPNKLSLDRDRAMVSDFDLTWETSKLWAESSKEPRMLRIITSLVKGGKKDVAVLESVASYSCSDDSVIWESVTKNFKESHGAKCIPVVTTEEYESIKSRGGRPVITGNKIKQAYYKSSYKEKDEEFLSKEEEEQTLSERLSSLLERISDRLEASEVTEMEDIIKEVKEQLD